MKKSAGFTLIEVLVAATIMSVVIVGTFMLLSSATRQWDATAEKSLSDEVELAVRTCIASLPSAYMNSIPGGTQTAVNFGTDNLGCATGAYDVGLTFTGISLDTYSGTGSSSRGASKFYQAFFSIDPGASSYEKIITQKIIWPTGDRTLVWKKYSE